MSSEGNEFNPVGENISSSGTPVVEIFSSSPEVVVEAPQGFPVHFKHYSKIGNAGPVVTEGTIYL